MEPAGGGRKWSGHHLSCGVICMCFGREKNGRIGLAASRKVAGYWRRGNIKRERVVITLIRLGSWIGRTTDGAPCCRRLRRAARQCCRCRRRFHALDARSTPARPEPAAPANSQSN